MIAIVGCGFLGSLVAEEIAKRWYAFEERTPLRLIDFDVVEERNAANQNFRLEDAQVAKAEALAFIINDYRIHCDHVVTRLTKKNIGDLLPVGDIHLIIDAVDNIETRRLLWYYGKQHRIPVLHLGVSQVGTGNIEWTLGDYDTWALSPINTVGQRRKIESAENIPKELKPCELIAFRGLGLNVAIAAAKAVGLWYGFDPEKTVSFDILPRTATTWDATNMGHSLREVALDEDGGFHRIVAEGTLPNDLVLARLDAIDRAELIAATLDKLMQEVTDGA